MNRLVADIQRQLNGDWPLLGPTSAKVSSWSLDWGPDARLRLPRMEDLLFGVPVHFPLIDSNDERQDGINCSVAAAASNDELASSPESSLKTMGDSPSPDKVESPASDSSSETEEICLPPDDILINDAQALQSSKHSLNTSSQDSPDDTALLVETPVSDRVQQPECQFSSTLKHDNDNNGRMASVNDIITAHSRAEIVLELEWAHQALRDRQKVTYHVLSCQKLITQHQFYRLFIMLLCMQYLRSLRRVEQGTTAHEAG